MPENQADAEAKARAFSVYMRPWTLDPGTATEEVPHLVDLDKPYQRPGLDGEPPPKLPRTRLRAKAADPNWCARSFAKAWSTYVRGNVVPRTAARLITQFMAANCGRTKRVEEEPPEEANCLLYTSPSPRD